MALGCSTRPTGPNTGRLPSQPRDRPSAGGGEILRATPGERHRWKAVEAADAATRRGASVDAVVRLERSRAVIVTEMLDVASQTLDRPPHELRTATLQQPMTSCGEAGAGRQ